MNIIANCTKEIYDIEKFHDMQQILKDIHEELYIKGGTQVRNCSPTRAGSTGPIDDGPTRRESQLKPPKQMKPQSRNQRMLKQDMKLETMSTGSQTMMRRKKSGSRPS